MALPLPKVVADTQAGGGLVTSMGGINSLANNNILRQINQIKKQYAPATAYSEAASKLAYANLMGPQFMAKLMGNDSALANMTEDQKANALNKVYQAANGNYALGQPPAMPMPNGVGQPSTNSLSGWIANSLKNAFGQKPAQSNNALAQNNGGEAYDESNYGPPAITSGSPFVGRPGYKAPAAPQGGVTLHGDQWYDKNGNPVYDEAVQQLGEPTVNLEVTEGQRPKTYAEKTGEYKGVVKEGEETGKIRANQINDLDDQYQQALQAEVPMEHLNELVTNPIFQKLRRDGAFQKLQLDAKQIIGTPEEKKLIGDFQTTAMKAVAETVMGFKGRILDKEISMANNMKINPNDSIDSILGKLPTIETFNEMTKERARIASKLMRDQHISKGDALEEADKRINGKEIREKIEKRLNAAKKNKESVPDFKKMSIEQLQSYIGE